MLKSIISFSLLYWISYFLWIYSQISSNSSNVVFSLIILENLQKSLWIMRKLKLIIEQDYLFSMIRLIFIFSTCSYSWRLYCRTFLQLCRRYLIIKKTNSENVSTPKVGVLKVEFALKLRINRSLKCLICFQQHCILSSSTLHSRITPFKKENLYMLIYFKY